MAGLLAERAFFHALGFHSLWQAKASTLAALGGGAFVAVTLFAFLNLYAVRQSIVSLVLPRQIGDLEVAEAIPTGRLTAAAAALALVIGAAFALLPHDWSAALLAWEGVAFREFEPFLERDLGFYVAWLPFERSLQERSTAATVAISALVTLLYALTPSIRWGAGGLYVSTWVRRHLAALAGLLVVLVGWDWRLARYELLADGSGVTALTDAAGLFTTYDHRVAMPYLAVASFVALPVAAVLVWAGWRGYLRLALAMLSVLILGGPVASTLLPLVARRPLEGVEAQRRERPYVNTSALFTRRAFGVDAIGGGDTLVVQTLPLRALATQVSAWDPGALEAVVAESAPGSAVAAIAWAATPSGLDAITLGTRVASGGGEPRWSAEAWRSGGADDVGRPYAAAGIAAPRIGNVLTYPGAAGYALAADSSGRIAAPGLGSAASRVLLAWDLQDPRLLFRDLPTPNPVLVTSRDVRGRVRRLLPFLAAGPTVTPVVHGDSLSWFVELFVTAREYPLSQPVTADGREVHYARHAGTAVVQAQTGAVTVMPTEQPDPVMRMWMSRFPDAFTAWEAAADWVRRRRPPALDAAMVQGAALAHVGFQGDTLGRRRLARADDADAGLTEGIAIFFQYDSTGALGWAVPVDIPWAGRSLGLLVARGGVERRTEFLAAEGPRWTSILERLQRGADSAGFGLSLPSMRRGRVQPIPTAEGPAWVQSYYAWPSEGSPRLAGVVVLVGDSVRTGRNLAEAVGVRLSGPALAPDAFRERVTRLYEAMQAALRAGDWRAYGEAWAALGRLVGRP